MLVTKLLLSEAENGTAVAVSVESAKRFSGMRAPGAADCLRSGVRVMIVAERRHIVVVSGL